MYSELFRPEHLDEIAGHGEAKLELRKYLDSNTFSNSIMLVGPPGIGKTTLALCAAKTMGFEPLEINASRSIRTYEDVEKLRDACRANISIYSLLCGSARKMCLILDEIDGSDPHAQNKVVEWIRDHERTIPIICTGNDLPSIFKKNSKIISILRIFPPKSEDIQELFEENIDDIVVECNHDIRRIMNRVQYGKSYQIPKYILPSTGLEVEKSFLIRQKMFQIPDPLHEYLGDKPDI